MPKPVPMKMWLRFLASHGLTYQRTKGSHDVYDNADNPLDRPVIVRPSKDKDVPLLHIQTSLKNMGLKAKEFEQWLKRNG